MCHQILEVVETVALVRMLVEELTFNVYDILNDVILSTP